MPYDSTINDKERYEYIIKDFPSFIKGYFRTREIRLGYKTMISYAYDYKLFMDFLKELNPSVRDTPYQNFSLTVFTRITLEDVEEFIAYLKRTCKKNTSVYRRLSSLSSLYTYMQKKELIAKNPFLLIDREKKSTKKVIRLEKDETLKLKYSIETGYGFTDNQVIRNHHNIRDYAIFSILLNEGLRVSELININLEDLNLEKYSVEIIRKGGDFDTIYLSDESINALKKYIHIRETYLTAETRNENALFLSQAHRRMSVRNVEILLKKYMSVSNPSKEKIIHVHNLRSTFATDFYEETLDIMLLKQKMGHKSIETTTIYTDTNKESMEKSRNIITKSRNHLPED